MTYFDDLSGYSFFRRLASPGTLNVGWLDRAHAFDKQVPSAETLDLLWSFCCVSVVQTRGIHECVFCDPPRTVYATRNGKRLLLGTSEIRVFSNNGRIYAAPNLIYHYIRTHHYKPPEEFLQALNQGPRPPAPEYFERLREHGIECHEPSSANWPPSNRKKIVRVGDKIDTIDAPNSIHIDED